MVLPLVRRALRSWQALAVLSLRLETRMKIHREGRMNSLSKKISRLALSLFFGSLFSVPSSRALDNGLALTPPMGWTSWNRFGCTVTEDLVKSAADALVSSALKEPGY